MFTGIVSAVGTVLTNGRTRNGGARVAIAVPRRWTPLAGGESVAVSGVCVTSLSAGHRLAADLSEETLSRTNLGALRKGDRVNLERALRHGQRLSGHFVLGHVDGMSVLNGISARGGSWTYTFSVPAGLSRFLVEKGSVALDGVSLTVASRERGEFSVAVIPETRRRTTLGRSHPGDRLNLEVDVFARYGARGWRRAIERHRMENARGR